MVPERTLSVCHFGTSEGMSMNEKINNRLSLLSKLSYYASHGIKLFVQDKPASPEQTVRTVMEEGGSYMADYVDDDEGSLSEIRFDRVENVWV